MKLYVIPIGARCNARCKYCITKFRKTKNNVLDIEKLKEVLSVNDYDKIEITGGGEPSLHSEIETIVKLCADKCPTNIYTNGTYVPADNRVQVCLSRAHYDDYKNKKIMGISYDIKKYKGCHNLKLSLILHQSGISTADELREYLNWAKPIASKVVLRQLFEYENRDYIDYFHSQYVSTEELAKKFKVDVGDMELEFETRSCACETNNPVLGADGLLREGWAEL